MSNDKKLSKAEFTELMKMNEKAKKARKVIESLKNDRFKHENQTNSYYPNSYGTW